MATKRTHLTIEGGYYLIILSFIIGGAVIRQINLLMFVAGIMIGPLLISWFLVRRTLQRLEVRRSTPAGVGVGELLVVDLHVRNARRRLHAWGVVAEDFVERQSTTTRERAHRAEAYLPFLKAQEERTVTYQGRIYQRGRYRLGPVRLTSRFPFGFLRRTTTVDAYDEFYVYPRLGSLQANWIQGMQAGRVGSQTSQNRLGFVEGEFHGLRDYRPGDSRRWIHWRTTAKRNQLTVRQFERQRNQDIAIIADLGRTAVHDEQQARAVEEAVSFAATVVEYFSRRGSGRVTLAIAGRDPLRLAGTTSAGFLQDSMRGLSVASATRDDSLPQVLFECLEMLHPGTRIIIVSPHVTEFSDTDRFLRIWEDPRKRAILSRVVCMQVGTPEFAACFDGGVP
ncbi:MAG: DUF58 domain-containing protein [Planctomycetales bacterium]|nr:DUF58 domain-containing protein [Planctomycetales bacterium]